MSFISRVFAFDYLIFKVSNILKIDSKGLELVQVLFVDSSVLKVFCYWISKWKDQLALDVVECGLL